MFCIQYSYMLFFLECVCPVVLACSRIPQHAFLAGLVDIDHGAAKDKLPLDSRRTNTLYFSWLDLNTGYYASCVND